MAIVQKPTGTMTTPPKAAMPQFNLISPSGNRLQVELEHSPGSMPVTLKNNHSPPPMYRHADTLYIIAGEDVFPLPKEMEVYDWGSPCRSLLGYTDIPLLKTKPDLSERKDHKTANLLQRYPSLPAPIKEACSRIVSDQDPAPSGDPTILTHVHGPVWPPPRSPAIDPTVLAVPGLPVAGDIKSATAERQVQEGTIEDSVALEVDVSDPAVPSHGTEAEAQANDAAQNFSVAPSQDTSGSDDESLMRFLLAFDESAEQEAPTDQPTTSDAAQSLLVDAPPPSASAVAPCDLEPDEQSASLNPLIASSHATPEASGSVGEAPVARSGPRFTPPSSPDQNDTTIPDTTLATVDMNVAAHPAPIAMRSLDTLKMYQTSPVSTTHAEDGEDESQLFPSLRLLQYTRSGDGTELPETPSHLGSDVFDALPMGSPTQSNPGLDHQAQEDPSPTVDATPSAEAEQLFFFSSAEAEQPARPSTPQPTASGDGAVYQQPEPLQRPFFPRETSGLRHTVSERAESVEITPPPLWAYNLPSPSDRSEAPTPARKLRYQSATPSLSTRQRQQQVRQEDGQQPEETVLAPGPSLEEESSVDAQPDPPFAFTTVPSPAKSTIREPSESTAVPPLPPTSAPSPSEAIWRKQGRNKLESPPKMPASQMKGNSGRGKFVPPAPTRPSATARLESNSQSSSAALHDPMTSAEPMSSTRSRLHPQLQAPRAAVPGPYATPSRVPLAQVAQEPVNVASNKHKRPATVLGPRAIPSVELPLSKKVKRVDVSPVADKHYGPRPQTPGPHRRNGQSPYPGTPADEPQPPTPPNLLGPYDEEFAPMDMTNANGPSGNMVLDDIRSSSPTPGGSGALPASNSPQLSPGWLSRTAQQLVRDISRTRSRVPTLSPTQPNDIGDTQTAIPEQAGRPEPKQQVKRKWKSVAARLTDDLTRAPETSRRAIIRAAQTLAPPALAANATSASPDPIDAFDPRNEDLEDLQVKTENIAEYTATAQADAAATPAVPTPRTVGKGSTRLLYSTQEIELLVSLLGGDDVTTWNFTKRNVEQIAQQMHEAGFGLRSSGALICKAREMRKARLDSQEESASATHQADFTNREV